MKYTLLIIASLLPLCCVGWAEAGFYDQLGTPVCLNVPQMPEGKCLFVKGISDAPDPCLGKMEAAMKAMDEWTNPWHRARVRELPLDEYSEIMHRWAESAKLWDATKRDCWKEH